GHDLFRGAQVIEAGLPHGGWFESVGAGLGVFRLIGEHQPTASPSPRYRAGPAPPGFHPPHPPRSRPTPPPAPATPARAPNPTERSRHPPSTAPAGPAWSPPR